MWRVVWSAPQNLVQPKRGDPEWGGDPERDAASFSWGAGTGTGGSGTETQEWEEERRQALSDVPRSHSRFLGTRSIHHDS
jgi:hypothetical protein